MASGEVRPGQLRRRALRLHFGLAVIAATMLAAASPVQAQSTPPVGAQPIPKSELRAKCGRVGAASS